MSVLSDDGKRVYYISWPAESSSKQFGRRSVAYVAVAGSTVRWWTEGLEKKGQGIVVVDNTNASIPGLEEKTLLLSDFFESRSQDYKSFIVFPVPARPAPGGRLAGIHISFKTAEAVQSIWKKTNATLPAGGAAVPNPTAYYDKAGEILDDTPGDLRRLLRQSINVIESLMRSYNEKVFEQVLRSRRRA